MKRKFIISTLILTMLAGCAIDPYTGQKKTSNTAKGGIIGVLGGAAIGGLVDGKDGALVGGVAGGLAGLGTGAYMDMQAKALREELSSTGVSVIEEGNKILLFMPGDITFVSNSYQVQDSFKPVLTSVAKVLKKYSDTFVEVVGYTDNTGTDAINNTLSYNRANAVANYLKLNGISASRMLIEGKGSSNPATSNATAIGRSENRRVELTLIRQ